MKKLKIKILAAKTRIKQFFCLHKHNNILQFGDLGFCHDFRMMQCKRCKKVYTNFPDIILKINPWEVL